MSKIYYKVISADGELKMVDVAPSYSDYEMVVEEYKSEYRGCQVPIIDEEEYSALYSKFNSNQIHTGNGEIQFTSTSAIGVYSLTPTMFKKSTVLNFFAEIGKVPTKGIPPPASMR